MYRFTGMWKLLPRINTSLEVAVFLEVFKIDVKTAAKSCETFLSMLKC